MLIKVRGKKYRPEAFFMIAPVILRKVEQAAALPELLGAILCLGGALALLAFLFSLAKKPVLLFLSAGAALLYELRFFQPFKTSGDITEHLRELRSEFEERRRRRL